MLSLYSLVRISRLLCRNGLYVDKGNMHSSQDTYSKDLVKQLSTPTYLALPKLRVWHSLVGYSNSLAAPFQDHFRTSIEKLGGG
jgi:hypothetical protein